MKEFSITLDDLLKEGLRQERYIPRNSAALTECFNLKPRSYGLVPFVPLTNSLSTAMVAAGITASPPFPQLFKGKGVTLLANATAIYTVNESTWALTLLTTYDAFNTSNTKAITTGGPWHFSDMHDTWFLYNGSCIVFQANKDPGKTLVVDSVTIQTGCSFRGRAITAGFDEDDYWIAAWQTLWNTWINQLPSEAVVSYNMDMKENFVWWSSIGGGDILWQFYPSLAETGSVAGAAHSSALPLLFDLMKRNEAGFMPMPWQGSVRAVKPLGNSVIVYGDGGVTAMPFTGGQVGMKHLHDVGIYGRGAVGGDELLHVFMDRTGYLYSIDGKLGVKRLGFQEFLSGLDSSKVTISYDAEEKDYYISDDSDCYCLHNGKLFKVNQLITSVASSGGTTVGIYKSVSDANARITTDIIDLRSRGIKYLGFVEVGIETTSDVYVAVDYRYSHTGSFTRTSWVKVNKEGIARIGAAGTDFRLAVKVDNFQGTYPSYVTFRYQEIDRRYVRGTDVSQINS